LDAADAPYFAALLSLALDGAVAAPQPAAADTDAMPTGMRWLVGLGSAAARHGMPAAFTTAVEAAALRRLAPETAADLLAAATDAAASDGGGGGGGGDDGGGSDGGDGGAEGWVERLAAAGLRAAAEAFDVAAAGPGFLRLSEPALVGLLGDARLRARSEEAVLGAVARWIRPPPAAPASAPIVTGSAHAAPEGGGGGCAVRGEVALRRVRFPLMSESFLSESAGRALPEGDACGPLLDRLVTEALELRRAAARRGRGSAAAAAAAAGGLRWLPADALAPRAGAGLPWARYAAAAAAGGGGGGLRLASGGTAAAVAVGDGWACVGLREGPIRVWEFGPGGPAVLRHTLSGHTGWVRAVAVWAGRLVSGSSDKTVRRAAAGRMKMTRTES
jgi:hypothetical protein